MQTTATAEKTSQVLNLYEYEIVDNAEEKKTELNMAKEDYEDLLREVEYLNSFNANIDKVNVNAIIAAKATADAELYDMESRLMQATALTVSEILELESAIKQQQAKCRVLAEESSYVQSLYTYDIPTDRIGDAFATVTQKAKEYDEAVKYGEIGHVTGVKVPIFGNYRKTSSFGIRINPLTGEGYDNHRGTDYGASTGTPVGALFSGTVIVAEYHYGMGNYIRIDHGDGIVSSYLHLSKIGVNVGDKVTQYDVIGEVGGTGLWSTAPHLHLALSINGVYVNPELLFNYEIQ